LAVLDFTRRAAILAGHPGRLVAFFDHAGFVDGQHRIVLAQVGQHLLAVGVAHGLGIPLRPTEEVLEGIRISQTGDFGQLPTVFALDGT
jgi:hypothetical protein